TTRAAAGARAGGGVAAVPGKGRQGQDDFFQAEDGIRDHCVTGVQTCARPISVALRTYATAARPQAASRRPGIAAVPASNRSEERRVGKEGRSRGSPYP